jgi:GNAT superfamily N-acetyltransferase
MMPQRQSEGAALRRSRLTPLQSGGFMHRHADTVIRRAGVTDTGVLVRLVEAYWQFEGIDGFEAGSIDRELRRLLRAPALGAAWIANEGDTPAGYLLAVYVFSLEHLGLTAEIDEFFIRPEFRGHGLGDRLLAAAEAEFRRVGCTNVSLQVGRGNAAGREFYLRRGYSRRSGFGILDKALHG